MPSRPSRRRSRRHFAHVAQEYAKWAAEEGEATNSPFAGMDAAQKIRESGLFVVLTPEQVLERAPALLAGNHSMSFMPLIGGMSPELGWRSLHLIPRRFFPACQGSNPVDQVRCATPIVIERVLDGQCLKGAMPARRASSRSPMACGRSAMS